MRPIYVFMLCALIALIALCGLNLLTSETSQHLFVFFAARASLACNSKIGRGAWCGLCRWRAPLPDVYGCVRFGACALVPVPVPLQGSRELLYCEMSTAVSYRCQMCMGMCFGAWMLVLLQGVAARCLRQCALWSLGADATAGCCCVLPTNLLRSGI